MMRPMGDQTHKVYDPQNLNVRFGWRLPAMC